MIDSHAGTSGKRVRLLKCVRRIHCAMTLGRLIYKSLLQITSQYDVNRLPLTGIVGLTEARFRYPPSQLFREVIQDRRQQPDFDGKCSRWDRSARLLRTSAVHVLQALHVFDTLVWFMQPVFELSSSYKPSILFSGVLVLSNRYGL